jgi:hypothetical protein
VAGHLKAGKQPLAVAGISANLLAQGAAGLLAICLLEAIQRQGFRSEMTLELGHTPAASPRLNSGTPRIRGKVIACQYKRVV